MGFRYHGQLQSIHHVDDFVVVADLSEWIFYAVTFGLLWALAVQALIFRDGFWGCFSSGAFVGVLFATVAVWRERGGVRRRRRR